jgi:hypothetical protein
VLDTGAASPRPTTYSDNTLTTTSPNVLHTTTIMHSMHKNNAPMAVAGHVVSRSGLCVSGAIMHTTIRPIAYSINTAMLIAITPIRVFIIILTSFII